MCVLVRACRPADGTPARETWIMGTESIGRSYLAVPDGAGLFPGVVVVHEASGLNDNIRSICGRFAAEGYAALGVDLFEGRSRAVRQARSSRWLPAAASRPAGFRLLELAP
jgi:dienelactone hydrolase